MCPRDSQLTVDIEEYLRQEPRRVPWRGDFTTVERDPVFCVVCGHQIESYPCGYCGEPGVLDK